MEYSLDAYRMIARQCGAAHRIARDTGNVKAATDLFATLWGMLDRETLDNHCDARAAFNAEFGRAYRLGQPHRVIAVPGDIPAPAPAPAPRYSDVLQRTHDTPFAGQRRAPAPRSVAADCAAFYASKTA